MTIDTSKVGLVRGVFIFSQWCPGYISLEAAKDENNVRVNVSYTPWHRHDEHPERAIEELEAISRCYSRFHDYEGALMYLEYRDYSK